MIELRTTVKNGALIIPPFNFSHLEGKDLVLTVKEFRSQRTISQNRLYWAILRQIADETWNDINAIHDFCRGEFLPPSILILGDREVRTLGHTPDQNTKEFTIYVDKIIAYFAMNYGIVINV